MLSVSEILDQIDVKQLFEKQMDEVIGKRDLKLLRDLEIAVGSANFIAVRDAYNRVTSDVRGLAYVQDRLRGCFRVDARHRTQLDNMINGHEPLDAKFALGVMDAKLFKFNNITRRVNIVDNPTMEKLLATIYADKDNAQSLFRLEVRVDALERSRVALEKEIRGMKSEYRSIA